MYFQKKGKSTETLVTLETGKTYREEQAEQRYHIWTETIFKNLPASTEASVQ